MRHTLRSLRVTTGTHGKPETSPLDKVFTKASLCKLSGIPHLKKLPVNDETLVDLMVGIHLSNEEQRQIEAERAILYDTDYFSGLVELDPQPDTVQPETRFRWPFRSKRREQNEPMMIKEAPEMRPVSPISRSPGPPRILSTALLYHAPSEIAHLETPLESAISSEFCNPAGYSEYTSSGDEVTVMLQQQPRLCSAAVVHQEDHITSVHLDQASEFTDVSTEVSQPRSGISSFLGLRTREREQLNALRAARNPVASSIYSDPSDLMPSLHMYSPWTEDASSTKSQPRALHDAALHEVQCSGYTWNKMPTLTRSKSHIVQRTQEIVYRTTRLPSASL